MGGSTGLLPTTNEDHDLETCCGLVIRHTDRATLTFIHC
jgi:hypothetical protein